MKAFNIATHEGLGRVVRPLYRAERRPARLRGFLGDCPPAAVPDASAKEIIGAIGIIAELSGIQIGRALDYNKAKDVYVVVGASTDNKQWGRVQEWEIPGEYVSDHIKMWRKIMECTGPADAVSWRRAQQRNSGVLPDAPR